MKVTKPPKIEDILLDNVFTKIENLVRQLLPEANQQLQQLDNTPVSETEKETAGKPLKAVGLNLRWPQKQTLCEAEALYKEYYTLITTHKATDNQGRYLYWDKVKYKYGKQAELVWAATKINRLAGKKKITCFPNHEFSFCVPDSMQALLHFIDTTCGSHIMLPDGRRISEQDRQTLMMEEAISSAQLEGAATTRKEAKKLLSSKRAKPKNHYEKMIVNNHRLMEKAAGQKSAPLSIDLILSLHRTATEDAIDNQAVSGEFRQTDDIHIADNDGNHIYQPPKFSEVPQLMEALCGFANTEHDGINNALFIHPVAKAIMLHFFIGYIHPFGDGNGRTARALFYWFMLKNGYSLFEYISISRLLNKTPSKYAQSYLYTESDDSDLTYFIYYQLSIIKRAISDLQAYVKRQSAELQNFTAQITRFAKANGLNRRQIEILQTAVKEPGRIFTVKDVSAQFQTAENTSRADLKKLSGLGLMETLKTGNAVDFIAIEDLKERLEK